MLIISNYIDPGQANELNNKKKYRMQRNDKQYLRRPREREIRKRKSQAIKELGNQNKHLGSFGENKPRNQQLLDIAADF